MCKAHVLRFSCHHGLLMSLEACPCGPCPILKTTGVKLPQQPYRCYNCERKRSATSPTSSPTLRDSSCTSSLSSVSSAWSMSSAPDADTYVATTSHSRNVCKPMDALPCVARQPSSALTYNRKTSFNERPFAFTCSSAAHRLVPHYSTLPAFLPHQSHPCPPCQLDCLRQAATCEVTTQARKDFPNLRAEQLVRNGRPQNDWQGKMTLERYVEEKSDEERATWFFVTKKWAQDLKRARVLVAEEDGLGLFL